MKRTKSKATAIIKCMICAVLVLSLSAASCTFAFAKTQYKGDVNSDSRINMKDVLFMRKHIAGYNVTIDKAAADINNDGAINMKDVLVMRKFIAGMNVEINEEAADVNHDERINMKDVLLMRKFIANIITSFD